MANERKDEIDNIAFIDGQNLHLGTINADEPWEIDLQRFRFFLERKYGVKRAYYYIGFAEEEFKWLYKKIQEAGFILDFKPHSQNLASTKKGNIDTDLIFDAMRMLCEEGDSFDKLVLVSGDGDYMRMVRHFIQKGKFEKVLFPNQRKASSLYKRVTRIYFSDLSNTNIRKKVGKRKGGLR